MGASGIKDVEMVQKLETVGEETAPALEPSHSQYLQVRHGSRDLDPIPDPTDSDPLNWAKSKKLIVLALTAFHAFMGTFTASAIQSAFVNIAADLDVSLQRTSYLTSLQIAILGGAPLFWRPLAQTWGRRPIFIVSLIGSLVANIGCAKSPTYATMALCRAIVAFFIAPAGAIGSGVVVELFFKNERARYMGIWTILVTLGVPVSPFIFGFLALRVDYRWIYYVLAMINAVQLILWLLFGFETLYIRGQSATGAGTASESYAAQMTRFRRINQSPLSPLDFLRPLRFFARPCVVLPAISYAMIFALTSVLITLEIPQLYPAKFGFNTQQTGLQFVGVIIGTVIGELIGGRLSDYWMAWGSKRREGVRPEPEFRLWLSYLAIVLAVVGSAVFLVCLGQATHWTVVPLVGAAIAGVGNQIVTTVLITYAVDCYRDDAPSIGVFITFVRQIWGFIGPFWYPQMIATAGAGGSAGIVAALIVVVSLPSSIALQVRGRKWRGRVE